MYFVISGAEKRMDGIERVQDLAVLKGGYVDAINIGNEVYVAVARPAYSGCGDAHILRCNAHLRCEVHMLIKTQAIYIQFYEQSGDYFAFVGHYGSYSTGCPSFPEILKFDQQSKSFTSLYNVTSHVYGTEKNLSLSDTVVQNIASLIPTALLTSPLHPRPIVYLGTLSTSLPTLSRVFSRNGVTYLVQALATDGTNSIELSNINKSTLAPTTLQKITTSEVTAIDIGYVEERTMLIVAEGRPGSDKDVKLFSFFDSVGKFYFFQKVSIAGIAINYFIYYSFVRSLIHLIISLFNLSFILLFVLSSIYTIHVRSFIHSIMYLSVHYLSHQNYSFLFIIHFFIKIFIPILFIHYQYLDALAGTQRLKYSQIDSIKGLIPSFKDGFR